MMNLLSLPNELFVLIFQYIPTITLLRTFGSLNHPRLTSLVQSFISSLTALDVTHERSNFERMKTWLPSYSSSCAALRITCAQLFQLSSHLPSLRSLEISEIVSPIHLNHLSSSTSLESLSLRFDPSNYDRERLLAIVPLLKSITNTDNHLRSLLIAGCEFRSSTVLLLGNTCRLQRLRLSVDSQASFEVLLAVLPLNIEHLTVQIGTNPNIPHALFSSWSPQPTRCQLRELVVTGSEVNYRHLMHTLHQQIHLHVLSLTITISKTEFIDGKQFYRDLLRHLLELRHLDFALSMRSFPQYGADLETYVRTFQDHPVLAYYNSSSSILNVCSHSCVSLDNISTAFFDYQTNVREQVLLPRVRFLRFVTTEPLPLVLLHFVRQIAPCIHHLVLNGHYLSSEARTSPLKEIPFDHVRRVELNWLNNQSTSRVLLRLTPNVKELVFAGYQPDYSMLIGRSEQLDCIRQQVHTVIVEDYQISERQTIHDNLKELFPQASILFSNM